MSLTYEQVKEVKTFLNDPDPYVRFIGAASIVDLCACDCISDNIVKLQVARDVLGVLPKETDKEVKPMLARALSALGSSIAVEPLISEAEKDSDSNFVANVAGALGSIDYQGNLDLRAKATDWLVKNLKNSDGGVRASCANALGKIDYSDSPELQNKIKGVLKEALGDEDANVILEAAKALLNIQEREKTPKEPVDEEVKTKMIKMAVKFNDSGLASIYRQFVTSSPEIQKAIDEKAIDGLKSLTPEDRRIALARLGEIGTKPTVRMDLTEKKHKEGEKLVA
ncbi:MAG: HEAT repeat domain-containing protein [Candidatus Micrarchaeota archaeon]